MERRRSLRSSEPGGASYPVQPIPEFPLLAPETMCSSFSRTNTDMSRMANSLATAKPTTPAPITTTSLTLLLLLLHLEVLHLRVRRSQEPVEVMPPKARHEIEPAHRAIGLLRRKKSNNFIVLGGVHLLHYRCSGVQLCILRIVPSSEREKNLKKT